MHATHHSRLALPLYGHKQLLECYVKSVGRAYLHIIAAANSRDHYNLPVFPGFHFSCSGLTLGDVTYMLLIQELEELYEICTGYSRYGRLSCVKFSTRPVKKQLRNFC